MNRIRTHQNWKKHSTFKPQRLPGFYYSEYQHRRKQRLLRIIILIGILFLLQSIYQLPFLRIYNIQISNNQDLASEDLQNFVKDYLDQPRFLIFKNNNFFILRTKPLKAAIIGQYNLNDVSIRKKFPNSVLIEVQEKISQFIWQKDGKYYLMDAKGALNRQIEALDNKHIILEDFRTYQPGSGQAVFRDEEIEAIQEILLQWQTQIVDLAKVEKISIGDNWGDLHIYTNIGFYVKITISGDIQEQMNNLRKVLVGGNIEGTDIDYIDVRFADKIYFK